MILSDVMVKRDQFVEKLKEVFGSRITLVSGFKDLSRTKAKFLCEKHGEFFVCPRDLLRKNRLGCSKCGLEAVADIVRKPNKMHGTINSSNMTVRVNNKLRPSYIKWSSMIVRSNEYYSDVEVCDDFKDYTFFHEWYEKQVGTKNMRWQLDKDILSGVACNKVYSPDVCVFVPRSINNLFRIIDYSIATKTARNGYKTTVMINNKKVTYEGFKTEEEAVDCFIEQKCKQAVKLAETYRGEVDERVIDALYNFEDFFRNVIMKDL